MDRKRIRRLELELAAAGEHYRIATSPDVCDAPGGNERRFAITEKIGRLKRELFTARTGQPAL